MCSICGLAVGAGLYRDPKGDPAHYYCLRLRGLVQANVAALRASLPPALPRKQSTRRVRR